VTVQGVTALEWLIGGLQEAAEIIVVGPARPTSRAVTFCLEEPRFGGPVAALGAAIVEVTTPALMVLGVDAPGSAALGVKLMAELEASTRVGILPIDDQNTPQPLSMVVRTGVLKSALDALRPLEGRSLRELTAVLQLPSRQLTAGESRQLGDFDTMEALRLLREQTAVASGQGFDPATTNGMHMSLERWVQELQAELGIDDEIDVDAILDLARVAAHGVQRPAAPLTAYMLGLAVARGADFSLSAAAIELSARSWVRSEEEEQG